MLVKNGRLVGCATAAGPAFEGSGLTSGMRAAEGAIERIGLARNASGAVMPDLKTIGDRPIAGAPGICGSAYIDFLAQARACGVLLESGRFDVSAVAANPALFGEGEHGRTMHLCGGGNGARISEPDIALLLQAKAAIAAGIETLLAREGLRPDDVSRVYLAGGFGLHLDVPHAIACGLLPGFATAQVEAVGNTSLAGAFLAMLDRTALDEMERVRTRAEIVELNLDPGFEDRYIDHLSLPTEAL